MTDQDMDMIEKLWGIKLMKYQKEILKKYDPGNKMYITMPKRIGRSYYMGLVDKVMVLWRGGQNDDK